MGALHINQIVKEQVGPEGFEPSPRRLRAGNAAANTSVPVIKSLVAQRIELGAPQLSAEAGQPARDYLLSVCLSGAHTGSGPGGDRILVSWSSAKR